VGGGALVDDGSLCEVAAVESPPAVEEVEILEVLVLEN